MLHLEKITISPQVLNLIAEIDTFKGAWNALEKHTTALQLLGDVANFGKNFKSVLEPWQSKPITEDVLCQLHAVATAQKTKSAYKTKDFPLIVQKGTKIYGTLDTATPEDAAALMQKLVPWLQDSLESRSVHPLIVIAVFTSVFLQIAPFEKGNQRVSRLVMTLLMFRTGYSYAPYVALEPLLNERLQEYCDVLALTQEMLEEGQANWEPWLIFMLKMLKDQKNVLAERLETGSENLADMPRLSEKVLKLFEDKDRLSMKEIERLTRGRRSTLKLRLNELVEGGYIARHGQARSTWYSRVA